MRNAIYPPRRAIRIALLSYAIIASAQQIQTIKILSQNEIPGDNILYVLVIKGTGFGGPGNTQVEMRPKEGIVVSPSTLSSTDKVMVISFQATRTYIPSSTVLVVKGKEVASFALGPESPPGQLIQSYRSILDAKTAADIFGRRMAKRFIDIGQKFPASVYQALIERP